jgi:hypothetical protein
MQIMQLFVEVSDDEDEDFTAKSLTNQKLSQLHFDSFQDAQDSFEGLSD